MKIEEAKSVFSNRIKQIPLESYKKFKIDYDQSNNILILMNLDTNLMTTPPFDIKKQQN